ncbi:hypothetical protein EsVE80_14030 [Enterococcus saigonensis]|uniref:Uncharacterized protein n=1 Tax=Enterococcus saigonensis TaxID=1805431 RepID=A0A679IC60_9ENTE|nr:hypothetical protein [Enterococcus saigonensis]BCA85880.1 hypothetical protein EsVE80_14030 [Enterococcus saigonensis]
MWRPVIAEKTIKSGILVSSLRLMNNSQWRLDKNVQELSKLGRQISNIMAMHMVSDELIIGVPQRRQQVLLFEVPRYDEEEGFHILNQISESTEGYFIRTEKIA